MSAPIQSIAMPVPPAQATTPVRPAIVVSPAAAQPGAPAPAPATPPAPPAPPAVQVVDPREKASRIAAELERIAPPNASLRFRVDPEAGRVVVSVVDAETGDVLRQIPSEEALAIAQSLADTGSGIVKTQA
jgi:flagellar protein FlaG